jgi:UDP-N-acetylmuramoyl-L-alanyl-D-glutamate--2,6-diaminopimelate ligase
MATFPAVSEGERAAGTTVAALAERLGARLSGAGAVPIGGVRQDSRLVEPADLFVALRGATVDGLSFAATAVERGAAAILCDHGRAERASAFGVPVLAVDDVRAAMARAAALCYGEPTRALTVVGITGTNGKTTTVHLVEACIRASGGRPAVVGTLGYRFEALALTASHTSPESDELQRVAARMRAGGASHLVMEVSSIALASARVDEVAFDVAAFTNLTQDHLDFHGTMAAYAAAKDRLFLAHRPRVAVVNVDDPHGAELAARIRATELLTVSARVGGAAVCPLALATGFEGIRMRVRVPGGEHHVASRLVGAHNVANLLMAVAIAAALGLSPEATQALESLPGVAGRLERCDDPAHDDLLALVDYAHTPDALTRVLASVRAQTRGRLWCVFGCGGDRDRAKRIPMGEAVARAADQIVVTNDNPRSEDPGSIAAAVVEGLERGGARGRYRVELDRARAIEQTVVAASPGDVVLVAGKGHETYQIIGAETRAFDDRAELRGALARRRAGRAPREQ